MVLQSNNNHVPNHLLTTVDSDDGSELISVNKDDKKDNEEVQILTPILLDSMFDTGSPRNKESLFLKDLNDEADDITQSTTYSFHGIEDLMIPSLPSSELESSSRATVVSYETEIKNEVHSLSADLTLNSFGNVESRHIAHTNNEEFFSIPLDVRYDGLVAFAVPTLRRRISLHPISSPQIHSIFVSKAFPRELPKKSAVYTDVCLADSLSNFGDYDGVEECKDEEEYSCLDEGFSYVNQIRQEEEAYWGAYIGHYGSRDSLYEMDKNIPLVEDKKSSIHEKPRISSLETNTFSSIAHGNSKNIHTLIEILSTSFTKCFSCDKGSCVTV